MPFPTYFPTPKSDRTAASVNYDPGSVVLGNIGPHTTAILALPIGVEAACHSGRIAAEPAFELIGPVKMIVAAPQDLRAAHAFQRAMADAFQYHARALG